MNTSVDPCEDFYYFANGGWAASHTLPADRGRFATFDEVADNNRKIMVRILESISQKSDKVVGDSAHDSNLRKLHDTYASCMDTVSRTSAVVLISQGTLDKFGIKPLLEQVHNVTGPFGNFDLDPLPEDLSLQDDDFRGTYNDDYVIPEAIRVPANRDTMIRDAKRRASAAHLSNEVIATTADYDIESKVKIDPKRRRRITQALAFLHSRGVDTLFQPGFEGDSGGNNSQISALLLFQSFGGLPSKEYYEEKPILDIYQSVVKGILIEVAKGSKLQQRRQLFGDDSLVQGLAADIIEGIDKEGWPWPWPGDDKDPVSDKPPSEPLESRMDKLASSVVKFEQKIARAGTDLEKLFNPTYSYNPTATKDVEKALPFIDLHEYFASFAPRKYPSEIIVTYPPYLKSITKLVAEVPDHVLSAYFVTQLSLTFGSALGPSTALRQHIRRLKEVLSGLKKGTVENRQDACLAAVDNVVGFIAGAEFVDVAFSPEAKEDGTNIIRSIVQAFHDKLPHISWMDKESYKAAQKKADALIPKVGYPLAPNTTDPDSLKRWYANVPISSTNHFNNILESSIAEVRSEWLSLGRERNRNSWEMNPQTVNAYYSPPDGEIVFPAGILQPPFYSLEWPAHLKYGAFGSVAAHELTHAFDNTGAQYDDKGLLRDWWTNSTVHEFTQRAQCLAAQYSKYFITDAEGKKHYINGNATLGENIGDSGLSQAYAAWQNAVDKKDQVLLPGLEYTPEQLFFISFARVWANLIRPAAAVSQIRTDPHSPGYWRAIGTLRNSGEFHKAFNCKKGSRMNPEHQCHIWE